MSARSSLSQVLLTSGARRRRRDAAARRHRHAVVGFKHRATTVRELRRILPQTSDDPASVRYLVAGEAPDIGGAGQLLFPGSAILLGECDGLRGANASDREGKAEHDAR